jgi:hypothetical protein
MLSSPHRSWSSRHFSRIDVSSLRTEITELATALGTLAPDLTAALGARPVELENVTDELWQHLVTAHQVGAHTESFETAFANGVALLNAADGLRGRRPTLVEWKGPHRSPGDDVIPADLRIDHVYLVSCKYLSRVLLNAGPSRLFERLLVGEDRATDNWFNRGAPRELQAFYEAARAYTNLGGLPKWATDLTTEQQHELRSALSERALPLPLQPTWQRLCDGVSRYSADCWRAALTSKRARLRQIWKLLRISNATYFVLGTDRAAHLRIRVASSWDWNQAFDLQALVIAPRPAGQPEVVWKAAVRDKSTDQIREILGHVEIRWSHGRFVGAPEAKVYLDSSHAGVPGYYELV